MILAQGFSLIQREEGDLRSGIQFNTEVEEGDPCSMIQFSTEVQRNMHLEEWRRIKGILYSCIHSYEIFISETR